MLQLEVCNPRQTKNELSMEKRPKQLEDSHLFLKGRSRHCACESSYCCVYYFSLVRFICCVAVTLSHLSENAAFRPITRVMTVNILFTICISMLASRLSFILDFGEIHNLQELLRLNPSMPFTASSAE